MVKDVKHMGDDVLTAKKKGLSAVEVGLSVTNCSQKIWEHGHEVLSLIPTSGKKRETQ
jgi:hypothetical protein